jgi:multiple sugar transport system permease protein
VSASLERRQARAAIAFVFPAVFLIGAFFAIPVVAGFAFSLTDFDIYALRSLSLVRFVGFANYADTLADPAFWKAIGNTMYFVLLGGPLSVALSLACALAIHERLVRLKGVFRTIYFAPVVTTLVAVAIVWRYLYHPRYGPLNHALGVLGIEPIDWLGDPQWAMPGIVLLVVWKNFGYNMLIFVAGLQNIPGELYEAAAVDGAGRARRFAHVTVPGLAPVFLFVGVTTMVHAFQVFAEPYVMTAGGPVGSTRTIVLLMYEQGFRWWRMGLASTVAVLLFAMTLAGTLVQLRLQAERR